MSGRRWFGARRAVLVAIALAGLWAAVEIDLDPSRLLPAPGGLKLAGEFFSGAFAPALTYEAGYDGGAYAELEPLLWKAARAAAQTVAFAAAAVSLSIVAGLILGFLGSTSWWEGDPAGGATAAQRVLRRAVLPAVYGVTRAVIAFMRSVHELLWAVLFLSAVGLTDLAAVIAIAIPYAGTFAKVFSEMVDEAPRDSAMALRSSGASPLQVFAFGLLPRALPDLAAYVLYRFECGLRSSAVLGFFGIPTLGYYLRASFENAHYREVWTYLYTLFFLVIAFDWWSGALRRSARAGGHPFGAAAGGDRGVRREQARGDAREDAIERLRRRRPRRPFVRWSLAVFAGLVAASWLSGGFHTSDVPFERQVRNIQRFIGEATPAPLARGESFSGLAQWSLELLRDRGAEAARATLAVAIAAIAIAGLAGLLLSPGAARNLAHPEPFLPSGTPPRWRDRAPWQGIVLVTRLFLTFARAIPEYIWAFLFLAMLGPHAWPAVLALALHNTGILGRLGAEVIENVEPPAPAALRGLGAGRLAIAGSAVFSMALPRFLLYFFYRWETCIREATILGLLGFASLGYWIQDARARHHYDEMLFFVLLGAGLVLVGDVVSALARRIVRRAA